MNSYIVAAFAGVSLVALIAAGVQTVRLTETEAERSSLSDRLETSLAAERTRAVAAERLAGDLRVQIAQDEDTVRDGPTAPVLLDVIRRLGGGGEK